MQVRFCLTRWFVISLLACAPCVAATAEEAWTFWAPYQDNPAVVDHQDWQSFLDSYVSAHNDGINRVDYARAGREDKTRLQRYLRTLTAMDPRTLNRNEQMAYWINLYNALTVNVVLANPGKKSIRRMGRGLFSFGPWDDVVAQIAGQDITLNDIEHRILRPLWQDHRIHFAVNCASLGCPNLSRTAYRGDNLAQHLSQAEQTYINHPRGVTLDETGKLILSSIFDWYQSDFAPDTQTLLHYLATHHEALGGALHSYSGRVNYAYNWQLNSTISE